LDANAANPAIHLAPHAWARYTEQPIKSHLKKTCKNQRLRCRSGG
jgi:hypothetical protein